MKSSWTVLDMHSFSAGVEVFHHTRMPSVWNPDQPQAGLQQVTKSLLKEGATACHNKAPSHHCDARISGHGCRIPSPCIEVTIIPVARLEAVQLEKGHRQHVVSLLCGKTGYCYVGERACQGKTESCYGVERHVSLE